MSIIAGPFHIIAGLLLVAGVAKLVRPAPTVELARAAGIPGSRILVRGFAIGEIAVATVGIVVGGAVPAAMIGVMYVVFAGFVLMLKTRGIETAGCGCFGQVTDDPPGSLHIAVDAAAALIATVAVAVPVPSIADVLAEQPLAGIPYMGYVGVGVWLMVAMLTELPQLVRLTVKATT